MSRTKRGQPRDVTLEAQAAAYLYSQGNDQAKIGAVLASARARCPDFWRLPGGKAGFKLGASSPTGAAAVEQLVFTGRNELRDKLRREAERQQVAWSATFECCTAAAKRPMPRPGRPGSTDSADWRPSALQELLPRMGLVGVTWGKTIARVVDGLEILNPHAPRCPGRQFHSPDRRAVDLSGSGNLVLDAGASTRRDFCAGLALVSFAGGRAGVHSREIAPKEPRRRSATSSPRSPATGSSSSVGSRQPATGTARGPTRHDHHGRRHGVPWR